MKSILILILSIICYSTETIRAENPKLNSWGYIAHYSRLNRKYLKQTLPRFNIISITGYTIAKNGSIKSTKKNLHSKVISISKAYNIEIYPLISFKSAYTGRRILGSNILMNRAINNILRLVKINHFKGLHLDFEYLPPKDSVLLKKFLIKLRKKLPDKKITMAIFPQVDFPEKWSKFHNLKIISRYLDEIVLMCYDYHRPGTKPGPVTDYKWAEKNIKHALKYLKPENIWLGIPAYGYRWPSKGRVIAISAKYGNKLAGKFGYKRDNSGNVFVQYKKKKDKFIRNTYIIYYSDKKMRQGLKKLAAKYRLKGTALWRIGFEDE